MSTQLQTARAKKTAAELGALILGVLFALATVGLIAASAVAAYDGSDRWAAQLMAFALMNAAGAMALLIRLR